MGSNAAAMDEERRLSGAVRTNYYSVVYDVLEEIEGKLQKVLSPTPDGELVGTAVVKQCFDIGKLGKVAGCGVETGWIRKSANIRVMRGDAIMYQGRLRTLRSVKVDRNALALFVEGVCPSTSSVTAWIRSLRARSDSALRSAAAIIFFGVRWL